MNEPSSRHLDAATTSALELLFDMGNGYVLDFSNASFARFVEASLGFDPYDRYSGSKASLLRHIWRQEPSDDVAKLNLDLLEHWQIHKYARGEAISEFEEDTYSRLKTVFSGSRGGQPSREELEFLGKDFSQIDLTSLPSELTAQQVVAARLDEIEKALEAEAPLAVIFLVGSTLEGLLFELALSRSTDYVNDSAAPVKDGKVKPIQSWTLAELIPVSRSLGVLGGDVAKHADQVRDFRNYIHPRQQLKEQFEPRIETARIAQQVLKAALLDLKKLSEQVSE